MLNVHSGVMSKIFFFKIFPEIKCKCYRKCYGVSIKNAKNGNFWRRTLRRLTKNKYNLHPSLNLSPIVKRTGQAYVSYDPFNTKCTSINIKVRGSTQQRKFVFNELNSIKKKSLKHWLAKICKLFHRIFRNILWRIQS